jgi:hypothetical protein
LFTQCTSNQENQFFYLPSDIVNKNVLQYHLDTYGIINKSKLLLREPITGDQISYTASDAQFELGADTKGINISTTNNKNFFFYKINNLSHKYANSIFTNLKSKSINIIFPTPKSIHLISDNVITLKKYVKKISNKIVEDKYISEIIVPKIITIKENDKVINKIEINNDTFLGMTYQISQVMRILSKDINAVIKASENHNSYINKLFFIFYNFIPNIISPFLFKFLLRYNKSNQFSDQILEIDNLYNLESYFFSNIIDEDYSNSDLKKGKFLPRINILDKKIDLKDLLNGERNIICSSHLTINSKLNIIYLKTHFDKKINGHNISQSSYERLNLKNRYYEVSSTGLILLSDLNSNLIKKYKSKLLNTKYSDLRQKSLDSFDIKDFKPSLPKFPKPRISFNWPFRTKKQ